MDDLTGLGFRAGIGGVRVILLPQGIFTCFSFLDLTHLCLRI